MKHHHISPLIILTAGGLFGFGLSLSEMISPVRVQGFFDIFGNWDPTLLFVMIGALSVSLMGHFFLSKKEKPFFGDTWHFSWKKSGIIDKNLIIGSGIFGIGWGLSGLCPGPAIASLVYGNSLTITFLLSLISSMFVYKSFIK
ncbi:YeeE/YedE family protein [Candidatus Gracilibacteria bacterium]|nr:YeeE/YedE family protein [Candidatus Gracilibacteria bacterium]